jgi:hypothetical protein
VIYARATLDSKLIRIIERRAFVRSRALATRQRQLSSLQERVGGITLTKDEEGAALIEYTVSFAILILAVLMGLAAVSRWIGALIVG